MPTPEEIRLQVFSSLAYGATGIWYYTYVMPRHSTSFKSAILDRNDKPTMTYEAVRKINSEALILSKFLIGSESKRVVRGASVIIPEGAGMKVTSSIADEALAGIFAGRDGSKAALLVNTSVTTPNDVQISLPNSNRSLYIVDKTNGVKRILLRTGDRFILRITPGDAQLLLL
jgi:hypothetical protein